MWDVKVHRAFQIFRLRRMGAVILGLLLSGCTTYGTIYVGQPQVHTRDRLVAERNDEAAWLRTKLKSENLDKVGDQVAGYRDLRAFTGLFASIKANLDPTQAAKKKLEHTAASMDEITWQIGYENSSSFRRLFKKYTGLSPREYRDKFSRTRSAAVQSSHRIVG